MNQVTPHNFTGGNKKNVSIRMPQELIRELKKQAEKRGHTFSEFVRSGLDQWAYGHKVNK